MKPKKIVAEQQNMDKPKYMPPKAVKQEHKEFLKKVGLTLQELRKMKNVSASALAKDVGISRNGYSQMERGLVYFHLQKFLQVLDYHKITAIDFFKDIE